MSRQPTDPLRTLTDGERAGLEQISRAPSAPAALVLRAQVLLAVADGSSYTAAARRVGRRSGLDPVWWRPEDLGIGYP